MIIYRMVIVEGRCDKLQLLISYIYNHWLTQKYSEFWLVKYNAGYCCYFLLPSYILYIWSLGPRVVARLKIWSSFFTHCIYFPPSFSRLLSPGREIIQLCQLRICKLVLRLMKMVFTCPGHCEIISCFNAADKVNKFQTLVKWIVWMTIKISTHGQCIGNAIQTWEENFNIFLFVKPLKALWLWLLKIILFKNREAENIFWECHDVSQDKENHPQELFTNTNDSSKPGKESQCFDGHHTLLHQHFLIKLNSDSIVCSSWIWWLPRLFCQISEKLKMLLRRQVTML